MAGISYVLPLRWEEDSELDELTRYLMRIAQHAEVVVVDGSDPELFEAHGTRWNRTVRHLAPDPQFHYTMGKVNGVSTGVAAATHEAVVIADDDVRYEIADLERMADLLERADLVRPQNYFDPLPWHALWDTARTLLNRAFASDYPGTLGVRKSVFIAMGGYDGDVMFENLELIRTVEAFGGTSADARDLYVRRIPPSTELFFSQRVRQAFDDLAIPLRMALWLSLLPCLALSLERGKVRRVAGAAAISVALAETGRRKHEGTKVFPAVASLFAPVWLLERSVTSWLATISRLTKGGIGYRATVIPKAANSRSVLRRRFRQQR
jgi:hypothetical protein